MARVSFVVPGRPFAKQRPRATRPGRVYTPGETVAFERAVGEIARPFFPEPLLGPLRVVLVAVFAIPSRWSRARRAAALDQPHTQRPDLDNLLKAADGLNRIAWADDAQVAEILARKRWGEVAETRVTVEEIAP